MIVDFRKSIQILQKVHLLKNCYKNMIKIVFIDIIILNVDSKRHLFLLQFWKKYHFLVDRLEMEFRCFLMHNNEKHYHQ